MQAKAPTLFPTATTALRRDVTVVGAVRLCPRCGQEKPDEEFHWNRRPENRGFCRQCNSECPPPPRKRPLLTPEHHRRAWLKRQYGITPEQYDEKVERQGGACAACGDVQIGRRLIVDHDHATGQVRGLLCERCNPALGMVGESPDRLRLLIAYLEKWGK